MTCFFHRVYLHALPPRRHLEAEPGRVVVRRVEHGAAVKPGQLHTGPRGRQMRFGISFTTKKINSEIRPSLLRAGLRVGGDGGGQPDGVCPKRGFLFFMMKILLHYLKYSKDAFNFLKSDENREHFWIYSAHLIQQWL